MAIRPINDPPKQCSLWSRYHPRDWTASAYSGQPLGQVAGTDSRWRIVVVVVALVLALWLLTRPVSARYRRRKAIRRLKEA